MIDTSEFDKWRENGEWKPGTPQEIIDKFERLMAAMVANGKNGTLS